MTSTLDFASKSCYVWCFPLTVQINQARWNTIVPHLTILSTFVSPPIMLSSHPDIPDIPLSPPPLLIFRSSPASHPACFYIPSAPLLRLSLHPSAHCVMSLLCESEHFVWQPKFCNATPLTWESQQSVVIVGETCLEAAVLSFSESKRAPWKSWKPERELWSTYIAQIGYSWYSMVEQSQSLSVILAHFALLQLPVFSVFGMIIQKLDTSGQYTAKTNVKPACVTLSI